MTKNFYWSDYWLRVLQFAAQILISHYHYLYSPKNRYNLQCPLQKRLSCWWDREGDGARKWLSGFEKYKRRTMTTVTSSQPPFIVKGGLTGSLSHWNCCLVAISRTAFSSRWNAYDNRRRTQKRRGWWSPSLMRLRENRYLMWRRARRFGRRLWWVMATRPMPVLIINTLNIGLN